MMLINYTYGYKKEKTSQIVLAMAKFVLKESC